MNASGELIVEFKRVYDVAFYDQEVGRDRATEYALQAVLDMLSEQSAKAAEQQALSERDETQALQKVLMQAFTAYRPVGHHGLMEWATNALLYRKPEDKADEA